MATNNRPLKAYVRFDGSGRIVAGSLILRKQKPKVGKWQEIPAFECCNPTPPTDCDCRPGRVGRAIIGWNYFDCNGVNIICTPGGPACEKMLNRCFDINQPYSGIEIDTEAGWTCECSTTTTSTSSTTTTTTTETPTTTTTTTTSIVERFSNINYDGTTYRNGDEIPQVTDPAAWAALTTGAWCYYNNDPSTEPIYGKLYNWYAVNDPRGFAPLGFHVPTDPEWNTLITFLGGGLIAGGKMKQVGLANWVAPNAAATNSSGFTGLPGGYRFSDGTFNYIGEIGIWWASTDNITNAWSIYLNSNNGEANKVTFNKTFGFSIRLFTD